MTTEHILVEIRRTAAANGGVPLGQARFSTETGIRYSDWHGKYWARFGDAVREAGLKPNQLNAAYCRSDDADLAKLQALRQQLGYQHGLFIRFGCGTATPTIQKAVWG